MHHHNDEIPFALPDKEMEAQVPDRFTVHDEQTANWVVRRVVEARGYAQRVKEWAEAEQRRARREEDFFLGRFGVDINRWLNAELSKRGGKAKSINLPAGRVGLRHRGAKIEVIDPDAVMDWARANCPEAIKQSESLLKTPLNEHFESTGELPAGTTLESERTDLYIR